MLTATSPPLRLPNTPRLSTAQPDSPRQPVPSQPDYPALFSATHPANDCPCRNYQTLPDDPAPAATSAPPDRPHRLPVPQLPTPTQPSTTTRPRPRLNHSAHSDCPSHPEPNPFHHRLPDPTLAEPTLSTPQPAPDLLDPTCRDFPTPHSPDCPRHISTDQPDNPTRSHPTPPDFPRPCQFDSPNLPIDMPSLPGPTAQYTPAPYRPSRLRHPPLTTPSRHPVATRHTPNPHDIPRHPNPPQHHPNRPLLTTPVQSFPHPSA